jgi:hypothetical protein
MTELLDHPRCRPLVEYLERGSRVSERHACKVLEVARAIHRYEGRQEQWVELRMRMQEIAQTSVKVSHYRDCPSTPVRSHSIDLPYRLAIR